MPLPYFLPDESVTDLIASFQREFPLDPPISKSISLAYANGDDWSVQKIVSVLNYRHWNEISFDEFFSCGADELKSYLSPEALSYYLPGLLTSILHALQMVQRTRLHEVSTLMLLPTTPDYQDVWNYFGDGLFNNWGTPFFMQSTENLVVKINYIRQSYTLAQRQCVARYIEIVESYGVNAPDAEFFALLKRFTDFWMHGAEASP